LIIWATRVCIPIYRLLAEGGHIWQSPIPLQHSPSPEHAFPQIPTSDLEIRKTKGYQKNPKRKISVPTGEKSEKKKKYIGI